MGASTVWGASGAATLMILGSGFCPDSSWRSCFASSRQCSLSERSSRNASCAMDNASRNPSTSARNAPVSGLLAGVERINRKMDFVPPVSRFAVADVSAMGGPRDGNRIGGEPRHEMVDETLPPIPGRKVPCGARPSVGQVTARKGQRIPGYYESVTPRQGILQMNVADMFAWKRRRAQAGSQPVPPATSHGWPRCQD